MKSNSFDLAFKNATRLRADAGALINEARGRSAIILGVFALEELGKALIFKWQVRNQANKRAHPSHLEKQSAAFALLAAYQTLTTDREDIMSGRKRLDFVEQGGHAEQFAWARAGFYDELRMVCTYADPTPKWPIDISDDSANGLSIEICEFFDETVSRMSHELAMGLASEIYKNGLGRL